MCDIRNVISTGKVMKNIDLSLKVPAPEKRPFNVGLIGLELGNLRPEKPSENRSTLPFDNLDLYTVAMSQNFASFAPWRMERPSNFAILPISSFS